MSPSWSHLCSKSMAHMWNCLTPVMVREESMRPRYLPGTWARNLELFHFSEWSCFSIVAWNHNHWGPVFVGYIKNIRRTSSRIRSLWLVSRWKARFSSTSNLFKVRRSKTYRKNYHNPTVRISSVNCGKLLYPFVPFIKRLVIHSLAISDILLSPHQRISNKTP